MQRDVGTLGHVMLILSTVLLGGCAQLQEQFRDWQALHEPVATHRFVFDPDTESVVGDLQIVRARENDTLSDIARRFNLGYEEIVRANPDIDPWLPRTGTEIILPTRFVLPDAPRQGVVINLPALRLYHFSPPAADGTQVVTTHPIGIGRVGWRTPEGATKITHKRVDPTWYPPASIRREHAANGDPLPAAVPPGPDNPLGRHSLRLGWPSYLIHGTNRPYGVGLRASHGCVRMYPEDIAQLYDHIPVGTPVTIVNQPEVYGWQGDTLWLQAFPVLEDDRRDHAKLAPKRMAAALATRPLHQQQPLASLVDLHLDQRRGIAAPVTGEALPLDRYLAGVPRVANRLPMSASWDGIDASADRVLAGQSIAD